MQVELIERERKYYLQQNKGNFEGDIQSPTLSSCCSDIPPAQTTKGLAYLAALC